MTRERRGELKRLSIDLDIADPDQQRLWEHWLVLSRRGEAARWARLCLLNAVLTEKAQSNHKAVTQSVSKPDPMAPAQPRGYVPNVKPFPKSETK